MHNLLILFTVTIMGFVLACAKPAATTTSSIQPVKSDAPAQVPDQHSDEHSDDAPRITLAEAKKEFDAGSAIFIDTRADDKYRQEHIKGAINVTSENVQAKYKEIPADKKVIAYCSWPSEHTSASLVSELMKKGTKNAYALVGGTQAWKDAGYPMEKSEAK